MNDLLRRRRAMMAQGESGVLNTSPKITDYNKRLRGNLRVEDYEGLCITDWIECDPVSESAGKLIFPDIFPATYSSMYQFYFVNGTNNWDYYPRMSLFKNITRIRFTIPMDKLAVCYAYSDVTGQIYFAAKGSQYYGYTNINDMPQG